MVKKSIQTNFHIKTTLVTATAAQPRVGNRSAK